MTQEKNPKENSSRPWIKFYKTVAWHRLRAKQLRREPLCRMCRDDKEIVEAKVVDHIKPHKGDMVLFFDPMNLQSLCVHHHNSHKQRMEKSGEFGCDESGIVPGWK